MRYAALAAVLGLAVLTGCAGYAPGQPFPVLHPQQAVLASAVAPAPVPTTAPVPTGITIPAIGAHSTDVAPMGLQPDGSPGVPPLTEVNQLGYYCPGGLPHCGAPLPGQLGPAVLLAHVNGDGKVGLFNNLWKLKAGDQVKVTLAGGHVAAFRVSRVQTVPKTQFPYAAVYGVIGHPALRLITCGPGAVVGKNYINQTIAFADLAGG